MPSVEQIITNLRAIDSESFKSRGDQLLILEELRGALRRVQSPWDIAWDHVWVHGTTVAATKMLIDASVFTRWAEEETRTVTTAKLADMTGVDFLLLRRLLRQIAADQLLIEVGEGTYAPTPWSLRLGKEPAFSSLYESFYHDLTSPLWTSLPSFLRETGFRNPGDITNSNFQRVHGEGSTFFKFITSDEIINQQFADAMGCHSEGNCTSWVNLYDTDQIIQAVRPGQPLVVDIGGSKGHDIEKFLQKHPEVTKDSLILQDLPEVLQKFTIHPGITACPYDFFAPQPVKGARVYYFHIVLHDWPDVTATKILENVRNAMEPRYSRILIHEIVVPIQQPSLAVTTMDIAMLSTFGSLERSEDQWRTLVGGIDGLRIIKIWNSRESAESIIEVERV